MKKTLIFTGAGMSVPLGLPSTTDFISSVERGALPITKHVIKYLGERGSDIELILATLEAFDKETPFVEFLLLPMTEGIGGGTFHRIIEDNLKTLRSQVERETTRIKKIIFDKLRNYDIKSAQKLYSNLINEVKKSVYGYSLVGTSISLVTTNYDLTFESAYEEFHSKWGEYGFPDVNYGFSIRFNRPIYDESSEFNWESETLEYLKIHGSLDWHRDANDRCSRSMSSTTPENPDQMVILYPGFKGVPEVEPFKSLHKKLDDRLSEADNVIVIGFAFRDFYINQMFENLLRTRKNVQVLYYNPLGIDDFPDDSMAPYFIRNYPSFRHIKQGIGLEENSLGLAKFIKKASLDKSGK